MVEAGLLCSTSTGGCRCVYVADQSLVDAKLRWSRLRGRDGVQRDFGDRQSLLVLEVDSAVRHFKSLLIVEV